MNRKATFPQPRVRFRMLAAAAAFLVSVDPSAAQTTMNDATMHTICSAYSATLAWQLAVVSKDMTGAGKMGDWAEAHASAAIDIDRAAGLQAWATRDIISQLTAKLKESVSRDRNRMLELGRQHGDACAALARKIEELHRR